SVTRFFVLGVCFNCGLFFVAAITYEPRVPFNAKGVSLVVVVLVAQLLFCVGVVDYLFLALLIS
nr:hypothetical protein [Tanacetum cinerariifolium]